MPLYDLMLLLDPGAPSDRHQSILKDVQGLLESGGTLVGAHDWGTRRMTFEIDHRPDAAYHLFQFETDAGGALLERVDHSLKIMDGVLRHRIIRLKDGAPPPPNPRPEGRYEEAPAAPADDTADAPAPTGDAPAAAQPTPLTDAVPTAEPVETAAPDASSLPAEDAADAPAADAPAPAAPAPDAPAPAPDPPAASEDEPAADQDEPQGGSAA